VIRKADDYPGKGIQGSARSGPEKRVVTKSPTKNRGVRKHCLCALLSGASRREERGVSALGEIYLSRKKWKEPLGTAAQFWGPKKGMFAHGGRENTCGGKGIISSREPEAATESPRGCRIVLAKKGIDPGEPTHGKAFSRGIRKEGEVTLRA